MDMYKNEHWYDKLQVLESKDQPLDRIARLRAMNRPLLLWYEEHARILPWREDPQPYRVCISEIMLQQTRVEAVKPYFQRFMEALPTIQALAEVSEEILLKLWEGLGYYNRVRNLQKAAQVMMTEFEGTLPASYDELLSLPGIGSYTAGAIASIAYGIPVPAVDGNVLRVISRVLASREDILKQSVKRQMEEALRETMPKDQASAFNQGLIEIGAIVCVPNGTPRCEACPLHSICLGSRQGLLDQIPYKTPKKPRRIEEKTVLILESGDQIAIQKRPDTGLLASLYEYPNMEGHLTEHEVREQLGADHILGIWPLPSAKHIFSHIEWHMTGYLVQIEAKTSAYLMVDKIELAEIYPLPNAFQVYTKYILGQS
ncbi:MAG: A/G-specific adenine glycosylase [Hungatella sp.]